MTHPVMATSAVQKLTYPVAVEQRDGVWLAQVLGWADAKVEAATRQEAIEQLHQLLTARLENVEIVQLTLDNPQYENPLLALAGKYKDDPQFPEVLQHIEDYRRELDAERDAEVWHEVV